MKQMFIIAILLTKEVIKQVEMENKLTEKEQLIRYVRSTISYW